MEAATVESVPVMPDGLVPIVAALLPLAKMGVQAMEPVNAVFAIATVTGLAPIVPSQLAQRMTKESIVMVTELVMRTTEHAPVMNIGPRLAVPQSVSRIHVVFAMETVSLAWAVMVFTIQVPCLMLAAFAAAIILLARDVTGFLILDLSWMIAKSVEEMEALADKNFYVTSEQPARPAIKNPSLLESKFVAGATLRNHVTISEI